MRSILKAAMSAIYKMIGSTKLKQSIVLSEGWLSARLKKKKKKKKTTILS